MKVLLAGLTVLAGTVPSFAQPSIWRDPIGGCAYVVTPQGGKGLRYLRDGRPDCPGGTAPIGAGAAAQPSAPISTVSVEQPNA